MYFEWLNDEHKGSHVLCTVKNGCAFRVGELSQGNEGKWLWRPLPKGEQIGVCTDIEKAKRCCEVMVRFGN